MSLDILPLASFIVTTLFQIKKRLKKVGWINSLEMEKMFAIATKRMLQGGRLLTQEHFGSAKHFMQQLLTPAKPSKFFYGDKLI